MRDAHVRIAQAGTRNVPSDDQVEGERGGVWTRQQRAAGARVAHVSLPPCTEVSGSRTCPICLGV